MEDIVALWLLHSILKVDLWTWKETVKTSDVLSLSFFWNHLPLVTITTVDPELKHGSIQTMCHENGELEAHLLTCLSSWTLWLLKNGLYYQQEKYRLCLGELIADYIQKIMSQTLHRSENSREVLFCNACLIQRNPLIGSHASSTCCYITYMYLLWFHPQKHPAFFFPQQQLLQWFFTNTIQNGEILLIKPVVCIKFFLSTCGSDIAVAATTTFPSGSSPKHHPRNGGTTGGWNHRWLSQQSQQKKTRWLTWEGFCKLLDTHFFWGLLRDKNFGSKFTRFKLQLQFSSWPFRSSPRSMYWTKIDCNRPHVSGWQ